LNPYSSDPSSSQLGWKFVPRRIGKGKDNAQYGFDVRFDSLRHEPDDRVDIPPGHRTLQNQVATGDDCSPMLEAEIPKGYSSTHGVPSPCAFTFRKCAAQVDSSVVEDATFIE
jgi:hypothetical protein